MKVAIHQPNYFPWIGYFYKMSLADVFVILDDSQYSKSGYQNRVKIKTPTGSVWMTQPVCVPQSKKSRTNEVELSGHRWREKHLKIFRANYAKSQYFEFYFPFIQDLLSVEASNLAELNSKIIFRIAELLSIDCRFVISSDLGVDSIGTQRLIDITKAVGGREYIHGAGGVNYQDEELFTKKDILCTAARFQHPSYSQLWNDFVEGLSIIDYLFSIGPGCAGSMFHTKDSEIYSG